ncbi:MAG: hypothetical protein RLZ34_581 [Pseudomonadota bacterium]
MTAELNVQDYIAVQQLYADYGLTLDRGDFDHWPDFFTDDCRYLVQPRDNHDRGLPLATIMLTSKGMLLDRVYGIKETLFHDPYYQRHVIGAPVIREREADTWRWAASYAVFRTKRDQLSTVFNVGRSLDTLQRTADGWRFASRLCVYDSEMVPNSIIYPV